MDIKNVHKKVLNSVNMKGFISTAHAQKILLNQKNAQ